MELHAGKYRHTNGQAQTEGACHVALEEDGLVIRPELGAERVLYYSDIDTVVDRGHAAELNIYDGQQYTIFYLGAWYGQFLADLRLKRSAQLIRNLMLAGGKLQKEFRGACPAGPCTVRLYQTGLAVEPDLVDPFGMAYADIASLRFDRECYALGITDDLGEELRLTMLGTRFGELEQEIRRLTEEMYDRTVALLQERLPAGIPTTALRSLAVTLRNGRAVRREELAAAAPGPWPHLQALLLSDEVRRVSFDHLAEISQNVYVGYREAFPEGEEPVGWYVCLFPDRARMAVEVTTEEGHATYVYRLEGEPDRAVRELSRAMAALNFRREVISASDEAIAAGRLERYQVALRKLPYVRRLRELFVGRAVHSNDAAWRRRIEELLT